jgi:hypothetical protein
MLRSLAGPRTYNNGERRGKIGNSEPPETEGVSGNSNTGMKTRMRMASLGKGQTQKARRNWKVIFAALTFVVLAAGALCSSAQQSTPPAAPTAHPGESAPPANTTTIRTTVELVNVPMTAMTKRGQRVIDLSMDEVKVFEALV